MNASVRTTGADQGMAIAASAVFVIDSEDRSAYAGYVPDQVAALDYDDTVAG